MDPNPILSKKSDPGGFSRVFVANLDFPLLQLDNHGLLKKFLKYFILADFSSIKLNGGHRGKMIEKLECTGKKQK